MLIANLSHINVEMFFLAIAVFEFLLIGGFFIYIKIFKEEKNWRKIIFNFLVFESVIHSLIFLYYLKLVYWS